MEEDFNDLGAGNDIPPKDDLAHIHAAFEQLMQNDMEYMDDLEDYIEGHRQQDAPIELLHGYNPAGHIPAEQQDLPVLDNIVPQPIALIGPAEQVPVEHLDLPLNPPVPDIVQQAVTPIGPAEQALADHPYLPLDPPVPQPIIP